jgi:DNA-binding NarL/FixJ family response regulator
VNPPILVDVFHTDPLVAAGLAAALRSQPDFGVREGCHLDASLGLAHVIVADYRAGLELFHQREVGSVPTARLPGVLVVTQRDREWEIRRALEAGVRGYLPLGCSLDELLFAVRSLAAGVRHVGAQAARLLADSIAREPLTPREEQVLGLVVQGRANKVIARDLNIGVGTVKSHLRSIYGKLDATSRTAAVTVAERRGLLHDSVPMSNAPRTVQRIPWPRSACASPLQRVFASTPPHAPLTAPQC